MLMDYVFEGGWLMLILAAMFFVVLLLVVYAALLFLAEVRRARRFRASLSSPKSWRLESIRKRALEEDSLPARFLARLAREPSAGATSSDRRRLASRCEDALVDEVSWPGEILHFLGAYATKVGLCGTILGLCLHFLAFGTEGSAQIASRAMAVALYTTLGALAVALVAEPAAYALSWGERWIRKDLQAWARFMEELVSRESRSGRESAETAATAVPATPQKEETQRAQRWLRPQPTGTEAGEA